MYRVSVYWAHGKSAWAGELDPQEITYQVTVRWRWVARRLARGQLGNRNALAFVIHSADGVVEEFIPEAAP